MMCVSLVSEGRLGDVAVLVKTNTAYGFKFLVCAMPEGVEGFVQSLFAVVHST